MDVSASARRLLLVASVLSSVAALAHLLAMPSHYDEWWAYGAFFMVAAVAQAVYAVTLEALRRYGGRPGESLPAPRDPTLRAWYAVGILGNLALVALWALTRTVGVPAGPEAGEVEPVGLLDAVAKLAEMGTVACLAALLAWTRRDDPASRAQAS